MSTLPPDRHHRDTLLNDNTQFVPYLLSATRMLEDYTRPLPCVFVLFRDVTKVLPLSMLYKLDVGDITGILPQLDAYHTAVMSWISAPRTKQELFRLVALTCSCTLDTKRTPAHEACMSYYAIAASQSTNPFCRMLETLLQTAFGSLHTSCLDTVKRKFNKEMCQGHWPQTPNHMLPHGAEGTIRGIIAWTTIDRGLDNESFVRTIKALLESAYPLVLPYVVSSRSFVPHLIVSVIEHACWLSPNYQSPTYGVSETVMSRLIKHCVDTMSALVRGWLDEHQRRFMIGDNAARLLLAYERAWRTCSKHILQVRQPGPNGEIRDRSWLKENMQNIEGLAYTLLHDFPELKGVLPPMAEHRFRSARPMHTWEKFFLLVHRLSTAYRCASPNCTRVFAGSPGFKYCGGCQRIMYCSPKCQKAAWTHHAVPHRLVCQLLRNMCEKNAVPKHDAWKLGLTAPATFDKERASVILEHFASQTRYELGTLRMYVRTC